MFTVMMRTILSKNHRYPTVGDWQVKKSKRGIRFLVLASRELGFDLAFSVMVHELVEAFLCHKNGVTDEMVTEWDKAHLEADEPGEVEGCPYAQEHMIAKKIEFILLEYFGISEEEYDKKVDSFWGKK